MSSEQEFKCVFCSESFTLKEDLQTHFRKHGDPSFNPKKDKRRASDANNASEKAKDQMEVVECDVCDEVFSSISKAITHKHKMHPDHDTKYFCPWCGKLFTMKHLYNKHINATHTDVEHSEKRLFHCDSCEVDFFVPGAMLYHNKFYHRQDELPNLGHSKKLKMILQEMVQIYYCPFCGEEHENKVNLHKHINEDHCGENRSPDDVFRCPLCDAIFFYLDAYELHLTHHSTEDVYTERNELMEEITDFSLETVQPIQEKVENADANNEEPTSMGIEELLEFTMNDPENIRKPKKHKKHKKSKKAAITLDEFLNMNKDVFGEGLDFQGVEEVPTQVITKRLKVKKVAPTSLTTPDIAKLKRQGIVIKKQGTKVGQPIKELKLPTKSQKIIPPTVQIKPKPLISTDAVLSKLLNQGSQIKIVKKGNQEEEPQDQQDNDEKLSPEEENESKEKLPTPEIDSTEAKDVKHSKESVNTENTEINRMNPAKSIVENPNRDSPSLINDNIEPVASDNCEEDINHSAKSNVDASDDRLPDPTAKLTDNVMALQNNSNITMKLPKKVAMNEQKPPCHENNIKIDETKDTNNSEKSVDNLPVSTSGKSSMNPLQHLSHLITVKPVNSSIAIPLPYEKLDKSSVKTDISQASSIPQNSSPKSNTIPLSNLKKLDGLTIKPTNKLFDHNQPKNTEDNFKEEHTTDDEWHDNNSDGDDIDVEKLIPLGKTTQLNIDTKHSPKILQKESPKLPLNINQNSQSSADLLKHLKNVTAKPVNASCKKMPTYSSTPNATVKTGTNKTSLQREVTEDGTEIFSIDDSDSDEGQPTKNYPAIKKENKIESHKTLAALKSINKNITVKSTSQQGESNKLAENINKMMNNSDSDEEFLKQPSITEAKIYPAIKKENKIESHKTLAALKNINKNITVKSTSQQGESNKPAENINKMLNNSDSDEEFLKQPSVTDANSKLNSTKPNKKNAAINNVLKNLSKNITVKSRNSSPSQSVRSQDSRDSHNDANDGDSDSDTPLSRVKITEMDNISDEDMPDADNHQSEENVKVEHPDDSHSDHDSEPPDQECDDASDIEAQIAATKVHRDKSNHPTKSKELCTNMSLKTTNNTAASDDERESSPTDDIPAFAKNLSNQISIKQIKKPESKNANTMADRGSRNNQSSVSQKMAASTNQVNTFNKEVKTVKTFQTQTKTVIQEITTTVTKTIKTVNQTSKQEVRNMAQSHSSPMIAQRVQPGFNPNLGPKNFQGMKVRQSTPCIRPRVQGQAPQFTRPAICAPPNMRPAITAPTKANQLVPVRPAMPRPSGPRSRMPVAANVRPSISGQNRPQTTRPVKMSPQVVIAAKKPAESPGHFSCFKKPKESLIPEPDFSTTSKGADDAMEQFTSTMQMSKSNFCSTSKVMKGNSVVTSTQTKSEMSASSQQLSKLRGMSGLVVKSSQSQAKQTHVEEKCEMNASKRNALEAIQKLQSQGLLVKKPRLDVDEESDHSQHASDDNMGHVSNEELDEDM